ncbi:hypothetical protein [Gordonia terrae]|uniref:hypothetical protein n=1 Tax=Gordonia terrae TaxID=2055 RepID=UPI003F6A7048
MTEFNAGDRVVWTAQLPGGTIEMAGKVVEHTGWRPLFSHWVQVTRGAEALDAWASNEFNLEPGALGGLLYLFDEQMEHID